MIPRSRKYHKNSAGFTMIELLIVIAIMGLLLAVAVPSMSDSFARKRLIAAAQQVHGHLQQARSEAIARSTEVFVNFTPSGATWAYGVNQDSACDPTTANACFIRIDSGDGDDIDLEDRVFMQFTNTDYDDVNMNTDAVGATGTESIEFSYLRGTATAGEIVLSSATTSDQITVKVSALGSVSICFPGDEVTGYRAC